MRASIGCDGPSSPENRRSELGRNFQTTTTAVWGISPQSHLVEGTLSPCRIREAIFNGAPLFTNSVDEPVRLAITNEVAEKMVVCIDFSTL